MAVWTADFRSCDRGLINMKDGRQVILVTGASGFVGRHLIPVLEKEGWLVRRCLRRPPLQNNDVLIETINPTTNWTEALSDVDAVVHLAARVHHPGEERALERYRSLNTYGTLHLARCAAKAGVRHFVYLSTVLVNGARTNGTARFSESTPVSPRGVYGLSKAEAESGLQQIADDNGMHVTVIRPPLIYGSGALGNFSILLKAINLGVPLPFASIDNRRSVVGVENLTSFISHRLSRCSRQFETFLVADYEQVSTPEFIRRIAKALSKKAYLFSVPPSMLTVLLKISGRPEAADSILSSMEIDISKALSTGWCPPLSLDDGLSSAVRNQHQ